MDHDEKVRLLVNYFKESEVEREERKLGLELEHMVVEKGSLEATSYYEEGGIEDLLFALSERDWDPVREGEHLLGLESDKASLTLEPGGQVEISIAPQEGLEELENVYAGFLEEAVEILERTGKKLLAIGYQPESSVEEIKLLPKKRYDYMYDYFADRGQYAHNMMKGTGSVHVNLDYTDEADYIQKNAVATYLTPMVYAAVDNSPFFEGQVHERGSTRARIWDNCDPERCGYLEGTFSDRFGYHDYAEYLLNVPVMIYRKGGELFYDKERRVEDVIAPDLTEKELKYLLSTVFPDVRTRSYLEVRMGDALPLPYSMAYAALWKGLLYDRENLGFLYRTCSEVDPGEYRNTREKVQRGERSGDGDLQELFSFYKELIRAAEEGLRPDEEKYLAPLKELAERYSTPKKRTLEGLEDGKEEALAWCDMKNCIE
ncbi:MAG: glutamate--cysteine ligase [Candidatus Acetothermia bacterium]